MTEYIDSRDISSELLFHLWQEVTEKTHYLAEFVELDQHESTEISIYQATGPQNQVANIVGVEDAPVLISRDHFLMRVDAFKVNGVHPFTITDPNEPLVETGDGFKLESDAMISGIQELDDYRQRLIWLSVCSMLTKKVFEFGSDQKRITVPYSQMIGDLPDFTGGNFQNAFFDAAQRFQAESMSTLDCVIVSHATAVKIRTMPDVKKYIETIRMDFDVTKDFFTLYGVKFFVDSNIYSDTLQKERVAVPDDVLIFIASNDDEGRKPLRLNRGKSVLNNYNSEGPHFRTRQLAPSPFAIGLEIYDNFIPTIAYKNAVMHWALK